MFWWRRRYRAHWPIAGTGTPGALVLAPRSNGTFVPPAVRNTRALSSMDELYLPAVLCGGAPYISRAYYTLQLYGAPGN